VKMEGTVSAPTELELDIEELTSLLNSAHRSRVKMIIEKNISDLGKELSKFKENNQQPKTANTIEKNQSKSTDSTGIKKEFILTTSQTIQLNSYYWDQDEKFVKVYVELEGIGKVPSEDIFVKFTHDSFEMLCNLNGKSYRFSLSNLANIIIAGESNYRQRPKRIVFNLKKKENKHWLSIFRKDDSLMPPTPNNSADPSAGIMDLMKQMYETGDEDMKKTISKAMSENSKKLSGNQ